MCEDITPEKLKSVEAAKKTRTRSQPCSNFTERPDDPSGMYNKHQCPDCGGTRMWCYNCFRDHHEDGWETCYWRQLHGKELWKDDD